MRAHYFQHEPFETLGSIEPWLLDHGYEIGVTRFFAGDSLPRSAEVDFLIMMGGSMSVNDEDRLPWLASEKRFIREFIQTGKPVLGICLGAQLIASSLGARVYPNTVKEIGWFDVEGLSVEKSAFSFPRSFTVFQWHGETFDLPDGAVRLARSPVCENQALQVGARTIGLQFHLEMTRQGVEDIAQNCRHELVPAPYIQGAEELLRVGAAVYQSTHRLMNELLCYITRVT